ncbi:alpha/beta hydrolase [Sulfitobacter sp. HNIBRBA3233]|uniref:alpha/beta hydrolase n=1 Tax=Sulfitobacter marinivivus TaxID=3158558 RepID=UPI0032DF7D8F
MRSEPAPEKVYLDYTQAELDRAYTQTEWADNIGPILKGWDTRGAHSRTARYRYAEHAYGKSADERIDLFDAPGPSVHFHVHGGAWQRQSKEACSFIAPAMHAIDMPLAVPEFGRLPETRMPDVFGQIARALVWTYRTLVENGTARDIVVSGHSSGAHMAALLASHDFGDALPPDALRAVLCISGSYDLHPVMLSARRSYIDLDAQEVRDLSPIRRIAETRVPVHLFYGSEESPEFRRQSEAYGAALAHAGKLTVCRQVAGRNHFEIADDLGTPDSTVGAYACKLLTEPHRRDPDR